MCGIVGYVGPDEALPIIIEGLKRLEYRGYDSAGVVVVDGELSVVKKAGKLEALEKELTENGSPAGRVGMGHTRWATHGEPNDRNAHPHLDCQGRVAVIHNGIIENFHELKQRLLEDGHEFVSDTDTECVAHLIEERYEGDLAAAVRGAVAELDGAYALVVLSADEPDVVVGVRVSSPMVIGLGDGENLLASDAPALLSRTRRIVPLADGQMVELRREGVRITDLQGNEVAAEPLDIDWDLSRAEKGGYEDFMLKEIFEQPGAVEDTIRGRVHQGRLVLDELRMTEDDIRAVDKVFVVACGTAFHAGLVAKYAIEHWTRLPVEIEISSEFRYRDPVLDRNTLTLAISQSGETIDTLEAVRHAKRQDSWVLAITNTVGSSVAREADAVLYTHAGPEIGVAATKTFATQMVALHLVALYLAQVRGQMFPQEIREVVEHLRQLPGQLEWVLQLETQVKGLADRYQGASNVLFIGRHTGFPAALEGALKLKEISYIHAEGFPAGELKHGAIALVARGVPVIAVATECHVYPKVLSNIQEVKARGAVVIAVATEGDREIERFADHVLFVPRTPELLSPVLVTVPLQLFAYHVAKARGCDVDQPRNLAKSVTVE
ncbi:MAG TPA: glutamine--fructose-6-phosphate transaminase (isomerizing) [Actinomycetota bacterium]|jgi:glucosamine--fructose-6-phosphate aminotransferase (isomerizing)|nr:glutamine--fructose-6-phosphate transaminase (isomerizing) [Actinomycetota bacterium]